uniref:Uncharacterized protein n=1 Tax=Steinernema glaseri TaxID=37863 RepID=A0A1I7ZBG2_9BILA
MLFTSGGSRSPNSHIATFNPSNDLPLSQEDRSGRSTPSSTGSAGLTITTEPLIPGQWTNVNSKVRIKQLTVSETKAIFALQKSQHEERRVSVSATFKAPEKKEKKIEKTMDEAAESGTTTGTKRVTTTTETIHHRIPDSPGSRSNYGEFYCFPFAALIARPCWCVLSSTTPLTRTRMEKTTTTRRTRSTVT